MTDSCTQHEHSMGYSYNPHNKGPLLFHLSVVSDSLLPHGLQHTRLLCPSPSPGVCSNSCPFESIMPSNQVLLRCSLLLSSIFFSIRVCSNESALLIRGPNYWSFSFSISPSNEHSGLISFRIDWLDLLAVQGYSQDGGVKG